MGRSDSLKQIAQMTELSIPTVVQILGTRGHRYREQTRQRVTDAAAKIGYRPNAAAKALNRGRFGCVAILCGANPWLNLLPQLLVDGIMDELNAQNMHLTLARLGDDKLTKESQLPKVLREWTADGMLINYNTEIPDKMQQLVKKFHLPAIWLNSKHESDCVHPDDYAAGLEATRQLIALGHRNIAFADYNRCIIDPGFTQVHYSAIDRVQGYRDACTKADLPTREIRCQQVVPELERIEYSARWLCEPNRPTAVITNSVTVGMAVWQAALKLQINVPQDLSIVTFSSETYGDNHLGITTWIVPEYEEGKEAVKQLCQKIKQPDVALAPVTVPFDRIRKGITLSSSPNV